MKCVHARSKPIPVGTEISLRHRLFRIFYPIWVDFREMTMLKRRRTFLIYQLHNGTLYQSSCVLDVGCTNGQDFVKFMEWHTGSFHKDFEYA
jgi:hypothetical protein